MTKNTLLSHLRTIGLGIGLSVLLATLFATALDYPRNGWNDIPRNGSWYSSFENILVQVVDRRGVPTTDGTVRNSARLGGTPASEMQRRITGTCPPHRPIQEINNNGSVRCEDILYYWSGTTVGPCRPANGVCGPGTQTQDYDCFDNLDRPVDDSLCTGARLTEPSTTQNCNATPCGCSATTANIGTRSYSVPAIANSNNQTVTSAPLAIANGACTYTATFSCTNTTVNNPGTDTRNTPCTCDSGYSWSGATSSCEPSALPPPTGIWRTAPISKYNILGRQLVSDCSSMSVIPGSTVFFGSHYCYRVGASDEFMWWETTTPVAGGVCGSATSVAQPTAPTSNLCATGRQIGNILDRSTVWTWVCGDFGGRPIECNANKGGVPPPPPPPPPPPTTCDTPCGVLAIGQRCDATATEGVPFGSCSSTQRPQDQGRWYYTCEDVSGVPTTTPCALACSTTVGRDYWNSNGSHIPRHCSWLTSAPPPPPPPPPPPSCVPNGSCTAATPACGTTTSGVDNCGTACTRTGSACPPPPSNSCNTTLPVCAYISRCTTVMGTPTSVNQGWVQGAVNCGYNCSSGWSGAGCMTPPACVPNGSCSAPAPACGTTTSGVDNCGNACTLTGPVCGPLPYRNMCTFQINRCGNGGALVPGSNITVGDRYAVDGESYFWQCGLAGFQNDSCVSGPWCYQRGRFGGPDVPIDCL